LFGDFCTVGGLITVIRRFLC